MSGFWLERAVVDGAVRDGIRVEAEHGRISAVAPGGARPEDTVLEGVVLPGIANAHSHAFHRALRGRTHGDGGDFWAWRERMYAAAEALDAETLHALASAVFAEMLAAGYTAVGEFHYVHRDPTTAMADAIVQAARDTGIRLTLLHTLYRHGGRDDRGEPLPRTGAQLGFGDPSDWARRHGALADALDGDPRVRLGAAVHSLRAVDSSDLELVRDAVGDGPLHAHVSEQPRENAQVEAAFGASPIGLLAAAAVLGPRFTAVHATHLSADDIEMLGSSASNVCICPTTERDLADGIGPARALADAEAILSIGSDQHVVLDPFDELRALEGHERLRSGRRGVFSPLELLDAATDGGYRSLGWSGGIRVGAECDLVAVDPRSRRTAGARPDQLWTAASAADVTATVVGGETVVDRASVPDPLGMRLADAIERIVP